MATLMITLVSHPIIMLFLIINFVIGLWGYMKSKFGSFEDYALASRSLPTGVLVMTLLGTFVGAGDLSQPDFVYAYGIIKILEIGCFVISFFFIGTFIAPSLVYFRDCMTLGDLMRTFYGVPAQVISSVIGCMGGLLIVSAQINAIGMVSEKLLDIDGRIAVIAFALLVIVYSFFGGMRVVSYTDVIQIIASFFVFIWLSNRILHQLGGYGIFYKKLVELHPDKCAILGHWDIVHRVKSAIFWGLSFTMLITMPTVQRMLITQNKRTVRSMWYISGSLYGLICLLLILIGLGCVVGQEIFGFKKGSEDIILSLVSQFAENRIWIIDVMFVGILGILLSTIDSYMHAMGTSLVHDIIEPLGLLPAKHMGSKQAYARLGVLVLGCLSLYISLTQGVSMSNLPLGRYSILISSMIVFPLMIGLLGIKSNGYSLLSFCLVYVASYMLFSYLGYYMYDAFLIAMPLAFIAYFVPHIVINRGIVTLQRSNVTVAEVFWIPSWRAIVRYIKSWFLVLFRLPSVARKKVVVRPMQPLAFSTLLLTIYTFSSVMMRFSSNGSVNIVVGIYLLGIMLSGCLMIENVWLDRFKPYFPFYWFTTLWYCLSCGATLVFLETSGSMMDLVQWIGSVVVLAFLVDSTTFLVTITSGVGVAMVIAKVCLGIGYVTLIERLGLSGLYIVTLIVLCVSFFEWFRASYMANRFLWNRVASNSLAHELRNTNSILGNGGRLIKQYLKDFGEIPKDRQAFFMEFADTMIKASQQSQKEIVNFTKFIEQQMIGAFEQSGVSMKAMIGQGVNKLEDKIAASSAKVRVTCLKDFKAKVLGGVFPNVIANLINNAVSHGKASEIDIKIDGSGRKVYVRDNGSGIAPAALPHIFDLHYTTVAHKSGRGTGVGLAFVKMAINASSGRITCHSRHGDKDSFTEFVIVFP